MICIKDALINARHAPNKPSSYSFMKGVFVLGQKEDYLFNFLSLKNQSLDEGSFVVDGVSIAPDEDDKQSLFMLKINSQNIVLLACFLIDKKYKSEQTSNITDSLYLLKDLPLETDEDKFNKVKSIINVVLQYKPAYLLFDKNNKVNNLNLTMVLPLLFELENKELVFIQETKVSNLAPLKILKRKKEKKVEEKPEHLSVKEEVKEKAHNVRDDLVWFFKSTGAYYKHNALASCFEFISILISFLFLMNVKYVLKDGHDSLGIVQLIGSIVCLIFFFVFEFLFVDYKFEKKADNTSFVLSIVFKTINVFIGIAVALGLFFLLANFDIVVKLKEYNINYAIPAIIIGSLTLLVPLLASLSHPFLDKFVKKVFTKSSKK